MEYKGWTLYDEVTLVIKKELHSRYQLPQAYVVNSKDKKQLKRAINWGTDYKYLRDEGGEYLRDSQGEIIKELIEPDVITLVNKGFEITLLDFANSSNQGGKLSFWNCIIENKKHNIKCVVGIASDLLLTLLIQNKFNYGKCEKQVMFARQSGGVGVIHEDMVEYQEALKDMQTKKDITKGKTSKWKSCHSYNTLTQSTMYFCPIYKLLDVSSNPDRHGYKYFNTDIPFYLVSRGDQKLNLCCDTGLIYDSITKTSELRDELIKQCDEKYNEIVNKLQKYRDSIPITDMTFYMPPIFRRDYCYNYVTSDKFPSRQPGDRVIEQDIPIEEIIDYVVDYVQLKILDLIKKGSSDKLFTRLEEILIRTKPFSDDFSDLSVNERNILKYLLEHNKEHNHYTLDKTLIKQLEVI